MKRIIFFLAIASLAVAAPAQDLKHRQHQRMKGHNGMALQQLNLTDDQKAKFRSQNEEFRKKMEKLRKNDNITVKEWRNKMETLRKDHQMKMKELLTVDQKLRIEKMKTELKAMREIDAKARTEKMKFRLGLSDEQAVLMNKSRTEMADKMKALRENMNLNIEMKRDRMKELMKQHKEKTRSILTEEQLKKLKELRGIRPPYRRVI